MSADGAAATPPDDIRPLLLWEAEDTAHGWRGRGVVNPDAHAEGCRVFWGTHGCARPRGHEGDHWCDCCRCDNHPDAGSGCVGGPPYYGAATKFSGADA